jgi:hypothetical protein
MTQPKLTRVQSPIEGLTPDAYIVYKQTQLCRCGHLHQWTQMMAENRIRSTLAPSKYSTIHRTCRIEDVKYNLPIRMIEAAVEKVLFCHECYTTATLSHLPPPPPPPEAPRPASVAPSWVGKGPTAKPTKPTKKKPETTIDDLLI